MEEEKDELETGEQTDEAGGNSEKPKRLLPLIIAGVVALVAGVSGGFWAKAFFGYDKGGEQVEEQVVEEVVEVSSKKERAKKEKTGKSKKDKSKGGADHGGAKNEDHGATITLDTFLVNLADIGRRRYLRTTLTLELSRPQNEEPIKKSIPRVRDAIIMLLSSKVVGDLVTVEGKKKLHNQLREQINTAIGDEIVTNVYLVDFIIQ